MNIKLSFSPPTSIASKRDAFEYSFLYEFGDVMGKLVKFEGEFYKNAQSLKPTKMWVTRDGKWKEHELPKTGM